MVPAGARCVILGSLTQQQELSATTLSDTGAFTLSGADVNLGKWFYCVPRSLAAGNLQVRCLNYLFVFAIIMVLFIFTHNERYINSGVTSRGRLGWHHPGGDTRMKLIFVTEFSKKTVDKRRRRRELWRDVSYKRSSLCRRWWLNKGRQWRHCINKKFAWINILSLKCYRFA